MDQFEMNHFKTFFEKFMANIQKYFLENNYKHALIKTNLLNSLLSNITSRHFGHNTMWYHHINTKEYWITDYNKQNIMLHLNDYYYYYDNNKKEEMYTLKILIENCEKIIKLNDIGKLGNYNYGFVRNYVCYAYSLNILLHSLNINFNDLEKKIQIIIDNNNDSRRKKLTYYDNLINNVSNYNEYLTLWNIIMSCNNIENTKDVITENTTNTKKILSKPLKDIRTLSTQIVKLIPELKDGIVMSTTANEYMKKKGSLELAINNIINDKEEITTMFEQIKNTQNEKRKTTIANRAKKTKQTIPVSLRAQVWNHWVGTQLGQTKCLCCNINEITQLNFACGHIVSEHNGGKLTITNLKPICTSCNSSMQTQNMNEFIKKYDLEMHKHITCTK